MQVTSTRVTEYKVKRQEAGNAAAKINRELSSCFDETSRMDTPLQTTS